MIISLFFIYSVLSTARNVFQKKTAEIVFGTKEFFLCQTISLLCGSLTILIFGGISWEMPSAAVWIYAVIYCGFLVASQWSYSAILASGNVALCSTVYSMGFIIPVIAGTIIWDETLSVFDVLGIICAILAVIISGSRLKDGKKSNNVGSKILFLIPFIAAGGLGIMQKTQQKSTFADQKAIFLIIAFALASIISFIVFIALKKTETTKKDIKRYAIPMVAVGMAYGGSNLLSTHLVGRLDSTIAFPTTNISSILLTLICGVVFYKEKFRAKEAAVLFFGIISIILLSIG